MTTLPSRPIRLYTHPLSGHAHRVELLLSTYPAIRAWLARVEALPGFVGMRRSPIAERLVAV